MLLVSDKKHVAVACYVHLVHYNVYALDDFGSDKIEIYQISAYLKRMSMVKGPILLVHSWVSLSDI